MAVTFKIKRRASTGSAGAPASLKSGELADNEVASDSTLYYGYGDDGSGTATSILAVAGSGAYATLSTNQTISGNKTFTGTVDLGSATISGLTSSDVGEGTNLYYTDARARAAISSTSASGVAYDNLTGVISLAGIPNSSLTNSSFSANGSLVSLGGSLSIQGTSNEVEVGTSGTTITIGLPNDVTIGNNLTVSGDLTVNGALTSLATTEVVVEDKNVVLGNTATPTDSTANGGGITLKGATDKTIAWSSSTLAWTFNQAVDIVNGGTLMIAGSQILSATRVMSNVAITGSGNTIDNVVLDGGTF
jgi:hypothetical protein